MFFVALRQQTIMFPFEYIIIFDSVRRDVSLDEFDDVENITVEFKRLWSWRSDKSAVLVATNSISRSTLALMGLEPHVSV